MVAPFSCGGLVQNPSFVSSLSSSWVMTRSLPSCLGGWCCGQPSLQRWVGIQRVSGQDRTSALLSTDTTFHPRHSSVEWPSGLYSGAVARGGPVLSAPLGGFSPLTRPHVCAPRAFWCAHGRAPMGYARTLRSGTLLCLPPASRAHAAVGHVRVRLTCAQGPCN